MLPFNIRSLDARMASVSIHCTVHDSFDLTNHFCFLPATGCLLFCYWLIFWSVFDVAPPQSVRVTEYDFGRKVFEIFMTKIPRHQVHSSVWKLLNDCTIDERIQMTNCPWALTRQTLWLCDLFGQRAALHLHEIPLQCRLLSAGHVTGSCEVTISSDATFWRSPNILYFVWSLLLSVEFCSCT